MEDDTRGARGGGAAGDQGPEEAAAAAAKAAAWVHGVTDAAAAAAGGGLPRAQLPRVGTSSSIDSGATGDAGGRTGSALSLPAPPPLHLGVSGGLSVREMAARLSGEVYGASPGTGGSGSWRPGSGSGRLSKVPAVQLAERIIRQHQQLLRDGGAGSAVSAPTSSVSPALVRAQVARAQAAHAGASQPISTARAAKSPAAAAAAPGASRPSNAPGVAAGGAARAAAEAQRRVPGAQEEVEAQEADVDNEGQLVLDDSWMNSGSE
jgi:hypothetical protein